jgi:hypothetical protein
MNWLKALGFGFLLFAVMFMIGSILMFGLKLTGLAAEIPMFIALVIVLMVLAIQFKVDGFGAGLLVGLIWLAVYALLDYFLIVRTFNPENTAYYFSWRLYLWYALIVVVPAAVGSVKKG